ncbi:adenosylcobinamide-phosphate synthase CbiB [Desmospora profundinema]|uniref:Cobalamin biosynthesis protein CobD n=1 Tax=Desmospora profundinema TaxID=1571184 RepID=A0ABU1IMV8_9BACL|nr:adenosylcobinamide-phosphate synthase CbiB [Desmospora profundinema]MDR6226106.1 adenosylcobinamide-phosphate synthase [Desmospora profundinema]
MGTASLLMAAYLLDCAIGDPRWIPHPVIAMGWGISRLESLLRRLSAWIHRKDVSGRAARLWGCLLPLVVAGTAFAVTWFILRGIAAWSFWAAWLVEAGLIAATIATKGLADAGKKIADALAAGDLAGAREALSHVVGRDTHDLDEAEVVRGGVETVSENIVDAVTSPLFYAAIGGAPLAMAYRAVNTLDSMVGYKNERYRDWGWASARLDDAANWLPARLTAPFLLLALAFKGGDARRAWRTLRRDAAKHPSPNSGWMEAAMAGGLGIQLGGVNRYQGVASHRATMGDPLEPKRREHIVTSIGVLHLCTALFAVAAALLWLGWDIWR